MKSIKFPFSNSNVNTDSDSSKSSLSLILVVLVFTMVPAYSYYSIIRPAMGAELTSVSVVPMSNIINQRATYDVFLTTGTTGFIKKIEITFPSSFGLNVAKLIEKSGIGSGSISTMGSTLTYTVSDDQNNPAGTKIRLEIGRIVAYTSGSFTLSVKTLNAAGGTIDDSTDSGEFNIKQMEGTDVSPDLMIRKTLNDDNAGHAHGWNPDGSTKSFAIFDSDIVGASDNEFIDVMIRYANLAYCTASPGDTGLFVVHCNNAPVDSAVLDYVITKLPANVVTSTDVSALKSSALSSALSKDVTTSQDMATFARHDDSASEFP